MKTSRLCGVETSTTPADLQAGIETPEGAAGQLCATIRSAFNLFYSFLAGVLMFAGLYGFALWAQHHDPEMLRILLASARNRTRYDPGKHARVDLEIRRC